ncbi:hypothetical protein TWF569_010588 [Orbilia oligospora]|nr:hypothetical protein TWF569_010588 [Orbilia oligospora]
MDLDGDRPKLHHNAYTVGWVCALTKEFTAACTMLDKFHEDLDTPASDDNSYFLGSIGPHNVVIACLPEGLMGTTPAATVAVRMFSTFTKLRFCLLVGIGGGVPSPEHDIRLGDIVVSVPAGQHGGVVQWDYGKSEDGGKFRRTGTLNRPPAVLTGAVAKLETLHNLGRKKFPRYLKEIQEKFPEGALASYAHEASMEDILFEANYSHIPGNRSCDQCDPSRAVRYRKNRPGSGLNMVHRGVIASGNQVVKDAMKREEIRQCIGDILCIEMEAAGLMGEFPCIVIRGICDYSDSHKNKGWQEFAAASAAAYAKELLTVITRGETDSLTAASEIIIQNLEKCVTKAHQNSDETKAQNSCLQSLRTTTYENFKDINPNCAPGTCQWFLRHKRYQQWVNSRDSSLLWVTADPGCGKSVLSRKLVDSELRSKENLKCGYFFFKNQFREQRSPENALSAILHQILSQDKSLMKHAMTEFAKDGAKLPSCFQSMWSILLRIAADPSAGEIVCILDALDECEDSGKEKLITHLKEFYNSDDLVRRTKLKFLVTSRPYIELEWQFMSFNQYSTQVRLAGENQLEAHAISEEIGLVIEERLKEVRRHLPSDNLALYEYLRESISNIPHRTYLWVALVFDLISRSVKVGTKTQLRHLLDNIPPTLDAAYEAILDRSSNKDEARSILELTIAATRPLTLREMNIAIELESQESQEQLDLESDSSFTQRVRNVCGLFVTVIDDKIFLIHQTAKEFLLSNADTGTETKIKDWKHSIDPELSNLALARKCISYLRFSNFIDDPLVLPPLSSDTFPLQTTIQEYAAKYPFLDYAARFWPFHFNKSNISDPGDPVLEAAASLCNLESEVNLTWFQVYWTIGINRAGRCHHDYTNFELVSFLGLSTLVKQLLGHGSNELDASASDTLRMTPLMMAAQAGSIEVIKLLLSQPGANPNFRSKQDGWTALYWAIRVGGPQAAQLLLEEVPDLEVNIKDMKFNRPLLSWATIKEQETVVRLLLRSKDIQPDAICNGGRTALSWAAVSGYTEITKMLSRRSDVDLNAKDSYHGRTPLIWAAEKGHLAVVEVLLKNPRTNPDMKDSKYNRAALSWAAEGGHEQIVKSLLRSKKVNINSQSKNGETALSFAIRRGRTDIMQHLLQNQAEGVDLQDTEFGRTPLSWAAGLGHEHIVRILLEHHEVNVESRCNKYGRTPLLWAAIGGHKTIVEQLLTAGGASSTAKDSKSEQTALSLAAEMGHIDTVKMILTISPDTAASAIDSQGFTPLMRAANSGYGSVVKYLLDQAHIDPNAYDLKHKRTALCWAAMRGHAEVVQILLDHGSSDVSHRSKCGKTARMLASESGYNILSEDIASYECIQQDRDPRRGQKRLRDMEDNDTTQSPAKRLHI